METHSVMAIEHGEMVIQEANLFKDGTKRDHPVRYVFKRVQGDAEFKDPRKQQ